MKGVQCRLYSSKRSKTHQVIFYIWFLLKYPICLFLIFSFLQTLNKNYFLICSYQENGLLYSFVGPVIKFMINCLCAYTILAQSSIVLRKQH